VPAGLPPAFGATKLRFAPVRFTYFHETPIPLKETIFPRSVPRPLLATLRHSPHLRAHIIPARKIPPCSPFHETTTMLTSEACYLVFFWFFFFCLLPDPLRPSRFACSDYTLGKRRTAWYLDRLRLSAICSSFLTTHY